MEVERISASTCPDVKQWAVEPGGDPRTSVAFRIELAEIEVFDRLFTGFGAVLVNERFVLVSVIVVVDRVTKGIVS
nr:hypothetical protein [Halegenticoccus tardaugens]